MRINTITHQKEDFPQVMRVVSFLRWDSDQNGEIILPIAGISTHVELEDQQASIMTQW